MRHQSAEYSRRDKFQEFRSRLEETFNRPKNSNRPNYKPVACRPVETPKLSHYESLRNFNGSSEKYRMPRHLKHQSAGEDSSLFKTSSPRQRSIDSLFRPKTLPDLMPLDLLKKVRQALTGDLNTLPAAYRAELYLLCTEGVKKLKSRVPKININNS